MSTNETFSSIPNKKNKGNERWSIPFLQTYNKQVINNYRLDKSAIIFNNRLERNVVFFDVYCHIFFVQQI